MAQTAANVNVFKPKATGSVWIAPRGTALPTDPTTSLNVAFLCAGYILKGGITQSNNRTVNNVVAWGGDIVAVAASDDISTVQFSLLEFNDTAHGLYRAQANVSTASGVRTTKFNSTDLDHNSIAIELLSTNGQASRIVAYDGQVTARGDIVFQDTDATVFPLTLTFYPDSNGNKGIQYDALVAAVPVLISIVDNDGTPATLLAAGGGLATIRGVGFTGTTAISIAGNSVSSGLWTVVNDGRIDVIYPAHTAGTNLPLIVTNATGASTTGATLVNYA